MLRVKHHGVLVAEVPNRALTDEAPVYRRPFHAPAGREELQTIPPPSSRPLPAAGDALMALLGSPTVASKRWIYEQYDYMVRTNTIAPGRSERRRRAREGHVDARWRCRWMATAGSSCSIRGRAPGWRWRRPRATWRAPADCRIGATNCLNFGNPERPEIMWQFAEAVAGLGEACRALEIPITGGNVSLYNETDGKAILPTPGDRRGRRH